MTCINTQKVARILTTTLSGVLAAGLAAATAAPALGHAHGTFTFTGSMHFGRAFHTATLLANGQVLVAGGLCRHSTQCDTPTVLASAELYNPSAGTWTVTGSMPTPRYLHTATLLNDGQVLVTGGFNGSASLDSAELYDPSTGTWSTTGSMTVARESHGAALLEDGEVLVAGGYNFTYLSSAELYDPTTGTWRSTGSMINPVTSQATRLEGGRVLVAGDNGGQAELYDPSTGTWTLTSGMHFPGQISTTAVLLTSGDVLVYGTQDYPEWASEFYNPSTNVWTATRGQLYGHAFHGPITLLNTGKVLLAGGYYNLAMLYDPSTNYWTLTGNLNQSRDNPTLTLLPNGQALAAGGVSTNSMSLRSAELYTP